VTVFDGRTEALHAVVREANHEVLVLLSPEHDEARRLLHGLRFAGFGVHLVEWPVELAEAPALREVARVAAHYLRARWIVPLRLGEAKSSRAERDEERLDGDVLRAEPPLTYSPRAGDRRVVVRTTTVPGPAHKEHVVIVMRPGSPRSVFLPLHVPMDTTAVRVAFEGLGCVRVRIDAVRVFRHGVAGPVDIEPSELSSVIRIVGPAMLPFARPLGVLALDGVFELILDIGALWQDGPCAAVELRMTATPLAPQRALASATLAEHVSNFCDPWFEAGDATGLAHA
jgi:hypothetical protein